MSWREEYQSKCVTADEAVKHIKSGDRLIFSHAAGEATVLTDAMVRNREAYENVEIVHYIPLGKAEYCLPENAKHFHHNTFCAGGKTRDAINGSRGDFTPGFFYEMPSYFESTLAIPDSVLLFMDKKKDLGLHSEMLSDSIVPLVEKGILNGKKKGLNEGLLVAAFAMGTRRLYDFMDDNPSVYMAPISYVNDPRVICKHNKVISINSCVQVDFFGQVCSESVGKKQISGVGGQVDFVRGATMSPGGKSIIACTSTSAGGKISKIIPFLNEGAAVTTSRNDVNYIVTEYGIAQLKGKTLKQRSRELINIAHPDFRDQLKDEFEKLYQTKF